MTLLAAAWLLGPMQPGSSASICVAPRAPAPVSQQVATVATDTTGVSFGLRETRIRWTRWNTLVEHGDTALLEGQVVTGDGAVSEASVDLLARQAGSSGWTPAGSAATDPDTGVFSFRCLRPAATTDYRVVYEGTLYFAGTEGTRQVKVARQVQDRMQQVTSERYRLSGSVAPRYDGRPVLLQRKKCAGCAWRTITRRETSARSRWAFTIDVSGFTGRRWFRAVVPADGSFVRSHGDHVWRLTSR